LDNAAKKKCWRGGGGLNFEGRRKEGKKERGGKMTPPPPSACPLRWKRRRTIKIVRKRKKNRP